MRKLKMWREKLKPPPPHASYPSNASHHAPGKPSRTVVKDDLAQGSDDTISANRFREQDELRFASDARRSCSEIV
jgi:hypothetical protein